MNTSKMILPAALTIFLAGGALITGNAIGAPHDGHGQGMMQNEAGMGGMPCPGMAGMGGKGYHRGMNATPEQREKARAIMQEAETKMQPMRDQMFIKREELRAMQNAATPDTKAVAQKASEINTLRDQMRKERVALGEKLDKELGLEPGTHSFGGYGHGGYGHGGYGHGSYGHKGGYGNY